MAHKVEPALGRPPQKVAPPRHRSQLTRSCHRPPQLYTRALLDRSVYGRAALRFLILWVEEENREQNITGILIKRTQRKRCI